MWIRADFGVGGDGSIDDISWYTLDFKPSAAAITPDLQSIYVANKVKCRAEQETAPCRSSFFAPLGWDL